MNLELVGQLFSVLVVIATVYMLEKGDWYGQ